MQNESTEKEKVKELYYEYYEDKEIINSMPGYKEIHILNEHGDTIRIIHTMPNRPDSITEIECKYDANGNLLSRKYPNTEFYYTRRENGLMESIRIRRYDGQICICKFTYDDNGNLILAERENGHKQKSEYDEQGRIVCITDVGSLLRESVYEYDETDANKIRTITTTIYPYKKAVAKYEYGEDGIIRINRLYTYLGKPYKEVQEEMKDDKILHEVEYKYKDAERIFGNE